ncbi:alpha-1-antitrypsin-like isoform X1 [Eublepharis macularius]|uniref:Alpha-1-antitrypsin-like isoform X1 n=1 Tax=Eublepharis macularius TaxID=481883 RepID=A0AA97IWJ3_EUBMA|nr:alpha-1-antitrypsin-like isoform X1 [Eublepharis macularius]
MKAMLYLFLLLFGLLFRCYHLSEPDDVHGNDRNTNSTNQQQHSTLEQECNTEVSALHKIVPYNADFAFRLYKQMSSDSDDKNIFFSPVSISTAFAMLALGAKSQTQTQIYNALAFNLSEIEENEIHKGFCQLIHKLNLPREEILTKIGNALFLDESLKVLPTFLEDVKTLYQAETFSTNFLKPIEAKQQVNDYLKNRTYGEMINKARDFSIHTVMVLVNYVFFKDFWREKFHPLLTTEKHFIAYGNTTIKKNFMCQRTWIKFLHDEDLSCSIVEIPYSRNAVAWFILPDEGKLKDVERSLVKEDINKWRASFQYRKTDVWIPKFSLSASYDFKSSLQRLGMADVFNHRADLSGITEKRNLRVSQIIHEAVLVVHEDDTMMGQGSPGDLLFRSLPPLPPPHCIIFSRPFLMFIIDMSTGTIFLMAKIVNPTHI